MLRHVDNFIYPPRCSARDVRPPLQQAGRLSGACLAGVELLHDPLCVVGGRPIEPVHQENSHGWRRTCQISPPSLAQTCVLDHYRLDEGEEGDEGDRATRRSMIRRHKYDRAQSRAPAIAEHIGDPFPLAEHDYDPVIPVRLPHTRLRWRSFNQAALLRVAITRRMGSRLNTGSLIRPRAISVPTAKDRQERVRHIHKAFRDRGSARSRKSPDIGDPTCDDHRATFGACAWVLLAVGARRVDVFTLARVL